MSAQVVPAAEVRPETFRTRAPDQRQRGRQRGRQLATGIASTLSAYRRYFRHLAIAEAAVGTAAEASLHALREWSPTAAEEVAATADGAGIDAVELMEIIARTEILTQAPVAATECSTLSVTDPGASVAAQNWDWIADFSTLWHINDVGAAAGSHGHIGIAEYGMLGKIGLNEAGVGVLLNILKHSDDGPGGVPVHMILEQVLSRASTLEEALEIIDSAPTSSSSVITVITADAAVQVEIAGARKRRRTAEGRAGADSGTGTGFLIHTNHFLHPDLLAGAVELRPDSTSQERFGHLEQKVAEFAAEPERSEAPVSGGDLVELLTTGPGEAPVCCAPEPGAAYGQRSATLATVVIDPARRQIDLAPGSPAEGLRGSRRFLL